ncbi:PREDICTED: high mobility group-T protein-like [Tarenaya hassleriana]|uniref:high mobility group-T protein-like n=1 Tax=Tarenaya hassleriana TaxID=28532 RepID=UPI00053C1CB0|nr:PREDICTED: high mobility group-T protein-like [Tarenaya hassleriana]
MALPPSLYLLPSSSPPVKTLALLSPSLSPRSSSSFGCSSSLSHGCSCSFSSDRLFAPRNSVLKGMTMKKARKRLGVVAMAPEEEKLTRRSPLDFPIEWERPKPGRRPDIFPRFSPMKTPLPLPGPFDPPAEDDEEDEEEEKKKEDGEEDDDPDKEEDDKPKKPK